MIPQKDQTIVPHHNHNIYSVNPCKSYTLKTIVLNLNPLELIIALSKCSVGDSTISAILNLYL